MRLTSILFALTLLAACTSPDTNEVPAPAPQDTTADNTATPNVADTPSVEVGTSFSQRPTAPLRIAGACPFECCTYGTWTTTENTTIYSQPDDTTSTTFTVPAETALEAATGHVLLRQIGTAVLRDSVRLYHGYDAFRIADAGDTLFLLDNAGEGAVHVWYADSVYQAPPEAFMAIPPDEAPPAQMLRESVSEWWAQVQTEDGRTGWLWMDGTPPMRDVDSCGG